MTEQVRYLKMYCVRIRSCVNTDCPQAFNEILKQSKGKLLVVFSSDIVFAFAEQLPDARPTYPLGVQLVIEDTDFRKTTSESVASLFCRKEGLTDSRACSLEPLESRPRGQKRACAS